MPVASLRDYLAARYKQLGIPMAPGTERQEFGLGTRPIPFRELPEETEDFPQFPAGVFRSQKVATEATDQSWWQKALEMFGAGEYAVAGFMRSLIRGGNPVDALTAAFEGFKSAFQDDKTYQVRMYDVLSDLGWNPAENSVSDWGKSAAGFILGIAADPLSYLTLGARNGVRLGGTLLKESATKFGVKIPEAYAKGQVLSRVGDKVYKRFLELEQAKMPVGAAELARNKVVRLALNTDVEKMTPELEAIVSKMKSRDLVDEALNVMGKEATDDNYRWFIREGYRDLLDKGGLKWFGRDIIPGTANYLTPRASSLHGLLLGERIATNAPLLTKIGEKIAGTKAMKQWIMPPIKKLGEAFSRHIGLDEQGREMVNLMNDSIESIPNHVGAMKEDLRTYNVTSRRKIKTPLGEVEVAERGGTRATNAQMDWLSGVLLEARRRGIEGEELDKFVRSIARDQSNDLHQWTKISKVDSMSDKELDGMVELAQRHQHFFDRLGAWENKIGIEHAIDEAYFPREFRRMKAAGLGDEEIKKQLGNWFTKQQVNPYGIKELSEKFGNRGLPGILSTNWDEIMDTRIGVSFRWGITTDMLTQMAARFAKDPKAFEAFKGMLKNRRFLERQPHMATLLAKTADEVAGGGLSKADTNTWQDLAYRLANASNVDEVGNVIADGVKIARETTNLTQDNVKLLESMIDRSVTDQVGKLAAAPADTRGKLQDIVKAISEAKKTLVKELNQNALGREFKRGMDEIQAELGVPVRPAPVVKEATRQRMAPTVSVAGAPRPGAAFMARTGEILKRHNVGDIEAVDIAGTARHLGYEIDRVTEKVGRFKADMDEFSAGRVPRMETDTLKAGRDAWDHLERVNDEIEGYAVKAREERLGPEKAPFYPWLPTPQKTAAAKMEVIETAWKTFDDLARQLPPRPVLEKSELVAGRAAAAREVRQAARKAGMENYLNAVARGLFGGKRLEAVSENQLRSLAQDIRTTTRPNEASWKFFAPPAVDEEFRQAAIADTFKARHPVTGELIPFSQLRLPAALAREVERTFSRKETRGLDLILGALHSLTSPFKKYVTSHTLLGLPRPGFFIRNLFDLSFRHMMGYGVRFWNPQNWKHTWGIASGKDGEIVIRGVRMSYQQIRENLAASGIFREGIVSTNLKDSAVDRIFDSLDSGAYYSWRDMKRRLMERWDKLSISKKLGRFQAENIGAGIENFPVINNYVSRLQAGIPHDQIVQELRRTFFAYQQLTDLERVYGRLLLPFYSYTRQALPLIAWSAAKNPGFVFSFSRQAQGFQAFTPYEKSAIPEWVRDYPHIQVERGKDGKFKIMSLRNVFSVDLIPEVWPTIKPENMRKFLSTLNPILMTPLELALGRDLYMDKSLDETKFLSRDLQTSAMQNIPVIKHFLKPRTDHIQVGKEMKDFLAVDANAWLALRQLWFSRIYREADTIASVLAGKISPQELTGFFTGLKIQEIDGNRQFTLLKAEADRAYADYRKALRQGDKVKAAEILEEYRLK